MNDFLTPGRLLDFDRWGDDRFRRHLSLKALTPLRPTSQSLPQGWDVLCDDEAARFDRGLWRVEEENAFLLGDSWRYPSKTDYHLYPLKADGDVLFPDRQWAPLLAGKSFIKSVDMESGSCLLDSKGYPPLAHFDEPVVFIGGSPNWGHWMADFLPRLLTLGFFDGLSGYKLAFNSLSPVQAECLDSMGISKDKRLSLDLRGQDRGMYSFARLAVVSPPPLALAFPWLHEKVAIAQLEEGAGPGSERVYLSRRGDYPLHRLANQDEVEDHLAGSGFDILHPEGMPLAELVRKMARARIVLSPIGAGLGNFLLAPQDAVLIHLLPTFLKDNFETKELFVNWMRYYYPLRDRLIFVFGSFHDLKQKRFAEELGLSGIDVPANYALRDIDMAIMAAEKQAVMKGRG
jgi:capsular polysaccharide biosynthesis protein